MSATLPRLCRGLAMVRAAGDLVLEGGPHRVRLSGPAARTLLPELLPLLDGTHRTEAVCARLSITEAQLDQALRLLHSWGVLESPSAAPARPDDQASVYYSRQIAVGGGFTCAEDTLARLGSARVLVIAGDRLGDDLAADLTASGVGTVTVADPDRAADPGGFDLLVLLDDAETFAVRAGAALRSGVPVLRCAAAPHAVEIGPTFWHGDSACPACFRRGYRAAFGEPVAVGTDPARRGLLAGLTAAEVLAVLGHVTTPATGRTLVRVATPDHTTEKYLVAPEPGCTDCTGGEEPPTLLAAYDWATKLPPEELSPPLRFLAPAMTTFATLRTQRDILPSAPRRSLPPEPEIPPLSGGWPPAPPAGPAPASPAPAGPAPDAPVDPARLAGILLRVAGRRGAGTASAGDQRWAPTGGNLAGTELYVLSADDPFGLPGTIFRYDDVGHRVVAVRSDPVPVERCLRGTGLGTPRAAIVCVGNIGRLHPKYGPFAWRLTHLEAGCAAMQLAATARGYGLGVSFATAWDGDLATLLEIDPDWEIVTAVAALHPLDDTGSAPCR